MYKKSLLILLLLIGFLFQIILPVNAQPTGDRPVITIVSYESDTTPAHGQDFTMTIIFRNTGQVAAKNLKIEMITGDLIPRDNGGLQVINQLIPGENKGIHQNFTVSADLWGASIANLSININYSDYDGNAYSDSFSLAMNLGVPVYSAPVATATPTPAVIFSPQLVIQSYSSDIPILQPGTIFELSINLTNLGNATAKSVSMVIGGGTIETNPEGTPQPGISSSTSDFTTFAPLDTSNIQYIGDIEPGESVTAVQRIIVNVSTTPGAHSLDYSFVYLTESGQKAVDSQVITLLIYRMPSLQVGFYMEPGTIFTNQPNNLPLQIVNLGKQAVVLGNMVVTANGAMLDNNMALVGAVDPGFYFTFDTMITPSQAGPLDVLVSINYTDDFNQPRVFETTLTMDVIEMDEGYFKPWEEEFPNNGGFDGPNPSPENENFWQKFVRVLKGLIGLDSGIRSEPMPFPVEEMPYDMPRDLP